MMRNEMGPNLRVTLAALLGAGVLAAAYYQGRHDGLEIGWAEGKDSVARQMQFVAGRLARQANQTEWSQPELIGIYAPATQPAAVSSKARAPSASDAQFVLDRSGR